MKRLLFYLVFVFRVVMVLSCLNMLLSFFFIVRGQNLKEELIFFFVSAFLAGLFYWLVYLIEKE